MEQTPAPESFPRWQPGDAVVLRYLTRDGRPGMAWPFRVVVDRDDLLALYIPAGATYKAWQNLPPAGRQLVDARWRRDVLRLMFPGQGHSIWLFWNNDEDERRFSAYYVNFEEPFRRSAIGFDTNDHTLDIVVTPDMQWTWKDAEDFETRIQQGIYRSEFAAQIRAAAGPLIAAIEARAAPFCDGWEDWTPDPNWSLPELHPEWATAPVMLWPDRFHAYGDAR